MTIVTDILAQMPTVRQPQRKFLVMLFAYDPGPARARHWAQSESVLRLLRAHDRAAVPCLL